MSNDFKAHLQEQGIVWVSPSALENPSCLRIFKYLHLGDRRNDMPVGVPAIAGTAAHDAIQGVVCDGLVVESAVEDAKKYIQQHNPISELDDLKRLQYIDDVELLIHNGLEEIAKLGDVKYESEMRVSLFHPALEKSGLEMMGFADLASENRIVELKTKWNSLSAPLKNGDRKFRNVKMPTRPDPAHVRQVSLYWAATGRKPVLIYITTEGSVTFSEENCDLMTTSALSRSFNQLLHNAVVWQNLLSISTDPKVLAMFVQPAWEDYRWRLFMPRDYLSEAEELFKV
tara:strand:- start:632 stop:1489 length:858 start_codon:yes stop_codon:yes gene_type:complete